jgi:flagellar capping protein FliD
VLDLKGNSDSQKTINDQLDDFNVRIEARRQQLLNQYSQVDALLRQFPLQQNEITSELNSLNLTKSS